MFEALSAELDLDTKGFTRGMAEAERSMGGVESKAAGMRKGIGMAGAAAATAGVAGFAVAAREAWKFESAMADVEKVTSKETAAKLEGELMSLAETIPVPREELVKLAEMAGKFGVEGSENITKFVDTVGKISAATDMTAEEVGTRFAKIAGAIGLPMSEIDKLGNAVNSLADNFKTDADEITDTMNRTSNLLVGQMGLTGQEAAALAATFNEVSPSSEKAAGALTSFGEAIMDPRKIGDISAALGMTTDEFKAMREENPSKLMNLIGKEMASGGESAEALGVAMGTQAARGANLLGSQLDATKKATKLANQQFKNGTSLNKEMAIRTNTAAGQFQLLKNQLQNVATNIGQKVLPVARVFLQWARKAIGAFSALNNATGGLAGVVVLLGAVVGGAAVALAAFWPMILTAAGTIMTVFIPAITTAIAMVGSFAGVLAGPLLLPLLAAAAAIAVLAYAWKNNLGGIQDKVKAFGAEVQRIFGAVMDWLGRFKKVIDDVLGGNFGAALTRAKALFREAFTRMGAYVAEAGTKIVEGVKRLVTRLVDAFVTLKTELPAKIKAGVIAMMTWVKNNGPGLAKAAFLAIGRGIRETILTLMGAGGTLITLFKQGIGLIISYLKNDAVGDLKAAAKFGFEMLVEGAKLALEALTPPDGIIAQAIGAIVTYLKTQAWSDLKGAAEFLFDVVMAAAEGLYQGLIGGSLFPDLFTDIIAALKSFATTFVNAFVGFVANVLTTVKTFVTKAVTAYVNLWKKVLTTVVNFVTTFINAYIAFVTKVLTTVKNFVTKAVATYINLWKKILTSLNGFVTDMLSAFTAFVGDFIRKAKTFLGNLFDAFSKKFKQIRKDVAKKAKGVKEDVIGFITDMKNSVVGPGGIIPNLKKDAVSLIGEIGSAGATAFKRAWNAAIPNSLPIPKVSVDIPKELGGGSISIGGGSISLPQLASGGLIEETGVFVGHAGERVLNPAETREYNDGGGGGGDTIVNVRRVDITVEGSDDPEAVADIVFTDLASEVERLLGTSA